MPVRQMKESSERHLVIKPHLQNPMNPAKKTTKAPQNGKGPPPLENESQALPHSKNKGRRRGRGGRKPDQGDVMMRPRCRPCTATLTSSANGNVENDFISDMGFPTSSKSLSFARRPGYGQVGTKCIVKANHFFAELPDKDLNQYAVRSFPWNIYHYTDKAIKLDFLSAQLLGPLWQHAFKFIL